MKRLPIAGGFRVDGNKGQSGRSTLALSFQAVNDGVEKAGAPSLVPLIRMECKASKRCVAGLSEAAAVAVSAARVPFLR